ncbi:MAG: peptide deformylase, partial [Bacteroidales bacterium]|nr:peptide deformylase [Bacteroidales bacterium]
MPLQLTISSLGNVSCAASECGVIEAINPEIVKTSGKVRDTEGCLSVPNTWGMVTRPKAVVLRAYDRNGEQYEL